MNYLIINWHQDKLDLSLSLSYWDQRHLLWQQDPIPLASLEKTLTDKKLTGPIQIVVLIPGHFVNVTEVSLPANLPKKNLSNLIGYALESELLEDINQLHFILLPPAGASKKQPSKDIKYPVAIISKDKLASVLQQLATQNITPDVIMPDYFAIPAPSANAADQGGESNWYASIIGKQAIVRTDYYHGYSVEAEKLAWLCQQLSANSAAESSASKITLHLFSDQNEMPAQWPDANDAHFAVKSHLNCSLEQCLSISIIQSPLLNLTQLDQQHKQSSTNKKPTSRAWRACAYGLAALIIISCISQYTFLVILKNQNQSLISQVVKQAKKYLPNLQLDSPYSQDTLEQLKNKTRLALEKMKDLSRRNIALKELNSLDALLGNKESIQVNRIEYQSRSWKISLHIKRINSLDSTIKALDKSGWQVIQSITSSTNASEQKTQASSSAADSTSNKAKKTNPLPYTATLTLTKKNTQTRQNNDQGTN